MAQRFQLKCSDCDKTLPLYDLTPVCPACEGSPSINYNYDVIREALDKHEVKSRGPGVWKYFELLPLTKKSNIISLGEGGTFLQKCERLAKTLGLRKLYVKNETTNPTGSFIDRGMTVLVSRAMDAKVRSLRCVPTGNLGASLAAYTAKSGLTSRISLSSEVNLGKLYQMIAYDADILFGDHQKTKYISGEHNGMNEYLVTPSNPFLIEGEKTIAYEVCEQLDWHAPQRIVTPIGTGGLLSMIWKGLQELSVLNFIRPPTTKVTGVQAEGCCPIVDAFRNQRETIESVSDPKTFAIDIRVGAPPLGQMALNAIKDSKGTAIAVSDVEILEAIRLLAKTEGVFAEPSAASTIAGLKKLIKLGVIDRDEEVVCVITGAGLKDPSVVDRLVGNQQRVRRFVHGVEGRRLTTKLGETKVRILRILSEREVHGYGVWKKLTEEDSQQITIPSVYQHLAELEALNLLRRREAQPVIGKRKRRYCSLTQKGLDVLTTLGRIES
jgi:threonine synthase